MCVNRVNQELGLLKHDLSDTRLRHAADAEHRLAIASIERAQVARWEAQRERERMLNETATKIQSVMRGFFIRKHVVPVEKQERQVLELTRGRIHLTEVMKDLRQTVHILIFQDGDKARAATVIQSWWRNVLARRVDAVLIIHKRLTEVYRRMDQAATLIQAHFRGGCAREGCALLRIEKVEREQQAEEAELARQNRSVVKIQSRVRTLFAFREAKARQRQLLLKLHGGDEDGSGGSDGPGGGFVRSHTPAGKRLGRSNSEFRGPSRTSLAPSRLGESKRTAAKRTTWAAGRKSVKPFRHGSKQ